MCIFIDVTTNLYVESGYCGNSVASDGFTEGSTNVGADNLDGCADYVATTNLCGEYFSYNSADGM